MTSFSASNVIAGEFVDLQVGFCAMRLWSERILEINLCGQGEL